MRTLANKSAIWKRIRNIVLSVLVMVATVVVAGVGYVWYMGNQVEPVVETSDVKAAHQRPVESTKPMPASDAPVGVSIQSLTSPVAPGENASIAIRTNALAICEISVKYDEIASTDSGLVEKIADEYGMVRWAWTVEATSPFGVWPVDVMCRNDAMSGMVRGDLEVARSVED